MQQVNNRAIATSSVLPTLRFTGDELFRLAEGPPLSGSHARATLSIRYRPSAEAAARWGQERDSGPGIYACFWDEQLFYVGTFAGNGPDSRVGNVARDRWAKHILGMTLRGRRLGLAPTWLDKIKREHDGPLAQLLGAADRAVLGRDKGLQAQYSKYRFAERHWIDFNRLNQAMLARFTFLYLRPAPVGKMADMAKRSLDPHLRCMEHDIIVALDPSCNDKSANTTGEPRANVDSSDADMRAIMSTYIERLKAKEQQPDEFMIVAESRSLRPDAS